MTKKTGLLIALVAVATMIDGRRVSFAPGYEVIGLHKADADALIACGAIEDRAAVEADAKADARVQAEADAQFAAAREAVQAQAETIAAPPTFAAGKKK